MQSGDRLRHPSKTARHAAHYRLLAQSGNLGAETASDYLKTAERLERRLVASGRCRHCGRKLTDELSLARGIGSTCWAKGAR